MSSFSRVWPWKFLGNQGLAALLQSQIQNHNLFHAYIFCGPAHVGKATLARMFVQASLCSGGTLLNEKPCGECSSCTAIDKNLHPDVWNIERAFDEKTGKTKKNISIVQIRELQTRLDAGSFFNSYRFGIIHDADTLSHDAANSLLKTLEEPPRNAVLILLATSPENLPATILSRCQRFYFRTVPDKEIEQHLAKNNHDSAAAKEISQLSCGLPGRAIQFASEPEAYSAYQEKIRKLFSLADASLADRFLAAETLVPSRDDHEDAVAEMSELLSVWTLALRDVLLVSQAQANENYVRNRFCYPALQRMSDRFSGKKTLSLLSALETGRRRVRENVNHRLILETFFLSL